MDRVLYPASLRGEIAAISSKSCAHRALICAAFCPTPTELKLSALSQDVQATIHCLRALGAQIYPTDEGLHVEPIRKAAAAPLLDCGESGSTLRFLLPVAAACTDKALFQGHGRLPDRPLAPLLDQLADHGATANASALPLQISRLTHGGRFQLPGTVSSQFASGLLLAAPLLQETVVIDFTSPPESLDYIEITRHMLACFGVTAERTETGYRVEGEQHYSSPGYITIEGDWSNSAFWLVGGALSEQGITMTGLSSDSPQGDRQILNLLTAMGADLIWDGPLLTVKRTKRLHAISIDAAQIPDLVPILAVAAALAEGTTCIHHVARLRLKESDRLATTIQLIQDLGGRAQEETDAICITGVERLFGGQTTSQNDHRIAMSAAIAATVCQEPVRLQESQVVAKSYPEFWQDYEHLGGKAYVL